MFHQIIVPDVFNFKIIRFSLFLFLTSQPTWALKKVIEGPLPTTKTKIEQIERIKNNKDKVYERLVYGKPLYSAADLKLQCIANTHQFIYVYIFN